MDKFNNEEAKHKKKKNGDISKANKKSKHKHEMQLYKTNEESGFTFIVNDKRDKKDKGKFVVNESTKETFYRECIHCGLRKSMFFVNASEINNAIEIKNE